MRVAVVAAASLIARARSVTLYLIGVGKDGQQDGVNPPIGTRSSTLVPLAAPPVRRPSVVVRVLAHKHRQAVTAPPAAVGSFVRFDMCLCARRTHSMASQDPVGSVDTLDANGVGGAPPTRVVGIVLLTVDRQAGRATPTARKRR